jgi:hypothetical protein
MMKTSFVLTASLSLAMASGCSSSSSPARAGADSGSDASTVTDATNPLGAPAAGKCPGVPCSSGQSCCYNPLSNTGLCQDMSMMCSGTMTMLKCSGPADCSGGKGCCIMGTFGTGAPHVTSACVTADQCTAPAGMMGFSALLCDSTYTCPSGESCVPSMFGQGSFCVAPDAGAGEGGAASDGQAPPDAANEG